MNWEGLIGIGLLIGLPIFLELFPRRPKWYCDDESMLRADAKIMWVVPCPEGSRKNRRIRTVVRFDDGFEYSACKDSPSGLFKISASKEEQMEVAEAAIKKHAQVVQQTMNKRGEPTNLRKQEAIDLMAYEGDISIASLEKSDKGRKVMVQGYVRYFFPTDERQGHVVVDQLDLRNGGGHDLEVEFLSVRELQAIFPDVNVNKIYKPRLIDGKLNSNEVLVSTDKEVIVCGTLEECERYPFIKLVNAIYYK